MSGTRIQALLIRNLIAVGLVLLLCGAEWTDRGKIWEFNIPRQKVDAALTMVAQQTGTQLLFPYDEVTAQEANPLAGRYSLHQALEIMLRNTGLTARVTSSGVIAVAPQAKRQNQGKEMNVNKRRGFGAFLASLFAVGGASAQDDVASAPESSSVEEIVVTAQRREQSVFDVPMSIVAFGEDDLKQRRISSFEELNIAVPGLLVQDNTTQRRIFMRGIGNFAGDSSLIGIYVDEASVTAGSALQLDLRIHDLERVEVLRGPQGTLYGQGSVGGAIRFITKDPQLDAFALDADLSASFTEDGDPGQKLQGVVNVPVVERKFGFRVAGTVENVGGWIDQPAANKEDVNDQDLTNVRIKALWHPTESLTAKAMAVIHRNDIGSQSNGEDENGNFTQAFSQLVTPSGVEDYEIYNVTLTYDFESFSLLSSTNYVEAFKDNRWFSFDFPSLPPPAPPFDTLFPTVAINTEARSQEFRVSSAGERRLQWTIGAFVEDVEIENVSLIYTDLKGSPLPGPPQPLSFGSTNTRESWAVFGDASFGMTDRFEIGAGLRYFEDDRGVYDGTGAFLSDATFDSLNPRVYANFDLTQRVKLYASVAKGFRSGGAAGGIVEPETAWSYEVGTKASLLEDRVSTEVSLYYTDYTDIIVRGCPPPPDPLCTDFNAGDAEIKGVDWSVAWHAGDELSLGVLGSMIETEFTAVNVLNPSHAVGDNLDWVPDYQFTLWGEYDFNWLGRPGSARLDFTEKGPSTYRNRNIGPWFFSESSIIDILNLHVSWQWSDALSVGVFGQNLLYERGFVDPAEIQNFAVRPRPRTFGVEVAFTFD